MNATCRPSDEMVAEWLPPLPSVSWRSPLPSALMAKSCGRPSCGVPVNTSRRPSGDQTGSPSVPGLVVSRFRFLPSASTRNRSYPAPARSELKAIMVRSGESAGCTEGALSLSTGNIAVGSALLIW